MQAQIAYRRAVARCAEPVRLVIMLYEQLASDLRNAAVAIEQKNVEQRAREVDHAFAVLGQLQGTLNYEKGGEVAQNLDQFYNLLRGKLMAALFADSPELLRQEIERVLSIREAWAEVHRTQEAKSPVLDSGQPHSSVDAETPGGWDV